MPNIFTSVTDSGLTAASYFICTLAALVCGVIAALAASFRNRITKSFFLSLILLPVIVANVIIMVNGNIEREMKFNIATKDEFCTGELSNGGITIGQDGADIDIYSIRCYANRQLTAQNVVKNYIATLPTAEEKLRVRTENDIMTGGRVDI